MRPLTAWARDERFPRLAPWLLVAVVALGFFPNRYVVHVAVLVTLYVTLAMGLSVVVGLAGLLDLGYVAFYAIGAYGYALLSGHLGLGFWECLLICWIPAAGIGVILGLPTLRVSGDYLALVTLGLGEIVRLVLLNTDWLTNGPRGIMGIAAPAFFGHSVSTPREYLWVGMLLASAATAAAYRIRFSRCGLSLIAVRDDEGAAAAAGLMPIGWKLFAFAVGAAIAAAAGVFFASWQRFVSPNSFTLLESVLVLSIVVIAGYARVVPLIGASVFVVVMPEVLRGMAEARLLIYGVLLVAVVLLQERRRERLRAQHGPAGAAHASEEATKNGLTRAAGPAMHTGPNSGARVVTGRTPVLEVVGLHKSFGGLQVLRGIDLTVYRGEIVGVIGPNGAGKSTLFGCIAGATERDAGQLWIGDGLARRPIPSAPWSATWHGVGRTFQDARLFEAITPAENVAVAIPRSGVGVAARPFLGGRRRELSSLFLEANRLLGLVGVSSTEVSGGDLPLSQQKRVGVARAIATRPKILLLDEPSAGMSADERVEFAQSLRMLHLETQIPFVIVEHDAAFLLSLATRIIILDQGAIVADEPPGAILRRNDMRVRYLGLTPQ